MDHDEPSVSADERIATALEQIADKIEPPASKQMAKENARLVVLEAKSRGLLKALADSAGRGHLSQNVIRAELELGDAVASKS